VTVSDADRVVMGDRSVLSYGGDEFVFVGAVGGDESGEDYSRSSPSPRRSAIVASSA